MEIEIEDLSIDEKFELIRNWYAEKEPEGFSMSFVDSVEQYYDDHEFLTDSQEIALNRIITEWVLNDDK